ncbi:MAG: phosphoribosylglycinamide formyltransferase, partial [Phycisphaerales bacterium]
MMNLCIMISGGGRTMMNLLRECREGRLDANIALVIASSMCKGVELARREGLASIVMPGVIEAKELKQTLESHKIDVVALAGYLKFVHVPQGYEGRIVNIHPALLPKYGGKG